MYSVSFANADFQATINHKNKLRSFVSEIFRNEKKELKSLQYVFCSDEFLREINNKFLKHDDYTDIISFDLSETEKTVGEIYISVERVKANANTFKTVFQDEIKRVIFHGALHLCGYKDKTKREIDVMRYKEDFYLRLFDL